MIKIGIEFTGVPGQLKWTARIFVQEANMSAVVMIMKEAKLRSLTIDATKSEDLQPNGLTDSKEQVVKRLRGIKNV